MKIDKLLLEQIIEEETQKALSEIANPFLNAVANAGQALGQRSPNGGGLAGSPQSPAYADSTQQANAQENSRQMALKSINALYLQIKNANSAGESAEIIQNVLKFVVNNGLNILSLSRNMHPKNKNEIKALLKAGQNMHSLITKTQQEIAADDVTAARPTQVADFINTAARNASKAAAAAGKPASAPPAAPTTPVAKPTPATGTRPRVVARRPAPTPPAASRTAE